MATFSADLDTDRGNTFLNLLEFSKSVTYRIASSGATSTITIAIQNESAGGGSLDDELSKGVLAWISSDDATPVKGDQITWSGIAYTIVFIRAVENMWEVDAVAEELIT